MCIIKGETNMNGDNRQNDSEINHPCTESVLKIMHVSFNQKIDQSYPSLDCKPSK